MRTAVLLPCALATLLQAQPSEPLLFEFNSPTTALWNFSGSYSETNSGLVSHVIIDHQPNGRMSGTINLHYTESLLLLDASLPARGRVAGVSGGQVNATMKGRGPLTGWFIIQPVRGTITMSIAQTLDAEHTTVTGREFVRACLSDGRCKTLETNTTFALPPEQDGAWSLALNLATTGGHADGTGEIVFSNGRTLDCIARGKFNPRSNLTTLRLTGVDPARRFALTLQLGPTNEVRRLRGSLLGQRLREP